MELVFGFVFIFLVNEHDFHIFLSTLAMIFCITQNVFWTKSVFLLINQKSGQSPDEADNFRDYL